MSRKAPKMTDLIIEETSGVDHPAHLHEGWLVIKASDTANVADVLNALPEPLGESMPEDVTEAVETDAPVLNADEDKGYDTEKLEDKIKSKLESHVKKSKFKVLYVDPTLEFVDVKFKEEPPNPPNLEISASLKSVKAEDNDDGKAQPALKFTLIAKFDLMSHGGGRKSRMTRRR